MIYLFVLDDSLTRLEIYNYDQTTTLILRKTAEADGDVMAM